MNILFTSVGRRVELMQAFRRAAERTNSKLNILGADMSMTAPALFYCDKSIEVCRIKDDNYIPSLVEVCQKEKVDVLIPTIDTDLLVLSKNREKFDAIGTKVLISAPDKIALCRDKRYTADFFVSCGLKTPVPVDDYTNYSAGFPAFIKPKDGSSSVNAYKVMNRADLEAKAKTIDDYIVQPFISGHEYTVDIFCDFNHQPVFITPRERLAVRSGEVLKTRICMDNRIIDECRRIIEKFEPVGQITVQLIRDDVTGEDYYIEINPRFGGGAPLTIKAGADSAEAVIRLVNDDAVTNMPSAVNGAEFSRFDQAVCTNHGDEATIKAVIFDLDDTLYGEKEYVRSGYSAIERETGISADMLWEAFENGKPAIDEVLSLLGKTELKERCLDIYRNHLPNIHCYDGVRELIEVLKDKGVFVGIITDGRPEGQRAKLEALGINVDRVIITDELGGAMFRKPCDIAYRMMQRFFNVDYSEMVYVGDNAAKDFTAPRQLGMQSIWFDNSDGLYRNDCSFAKCIHSIKELADILTKALN